MVIDGITLVRGLAPRTLPPDTIYCRAPGTGVICQVSCTRCPIHSRLPYRMYPCSEMFFRLISRPILRRPHAPAIPIPST